MYRLTKSQYIQRISDGAFIPPNVDNKDYREYQAWVAVGNTPAPYQPIPEEVAAEAAKQKLAQDVAVAKRYAKLQTLSSMTPAEVQTWAEATINTLPDAKDAITALAIAVSILLRQLEAA